MDYPAFLNSEQQHPYDGVPFHPSSFLPHSNPMYPYYPSNGILNNMPSSAFSGTYHDPSLLVPYDNSTNISNVVYRNPYYVGMYVNQQPVNATINFTDYVDPNRIRCQVSLEQPVDGRQILWVDLEHIGPPHDNNSMNISNVVHRNPWVGDYVGMFVNQQPVNATINFIDYVDPNRIRCQVSLEQPVDGRQILWVDLEHIGPPHTADSWGYYNPQSISTTEITANAPTPFLIDLTKDDTDTVDTTTSSCYTLSTVESE